MKSGLFESWCRSVEIIGRENTQDRNIILVFDDKKLDGLLYYDEKVGYCSLGYTDGTGYVVDMMDFFYLMTFINIFSSTKKIKDNFIEFKKKENKAIVKVLYSKGVFLPVWEKGKKVEFAVFDYEEGYDYYLANGKFYIINDNLCLVKDSKLDRCVYAKLPGMFIEVIKEVDFSKFVLGDRTLFMAHKDLEITIFYDRESIIDCGYENIKKESDIVQKRGLR